MGRVYEARQRALDRRVAVKCIHPHLLATDHMVVRFMEEARVASQLVHPNVVQIYDFGRTQPSEGGTLFIVMELLSGKNLSTVIADEAPFPMARTHAILRAILSALGEAHARGITHRDAKPENVILEPTPGRADGRGDGRGERVKIIDFGIARVHGARGVTSVGQFIGTPHFMPPEQIRGEPAEVSSDLYAVGVTLFQMLTGRLPFDAGTVTGVLEQQLYAPRPDPRDVAPEGACPPALAEVCLRALDVDRARRYPTADAFAEALDGAVLRSQPPRRRRSTAPPPGPVATASTGIVDPFDVPAQRPISVPPPASGVRGVSLEAGERIERVARAALASGQHDLAIRELERGLRMGAEAFRMGDAPLGRSAITVFGRLLGVALRECGRLEASAQALREALPHSEGDAHARARLLMELTRSLAMAGLLEDAEAARVQALRLASDLSDPVLRADLRRLAQSVAPPGQRVPSAPAPAPRRSEWRFRPDGAGPPGRSALPGVPSRHRR
jgi:serine/threonine-protein kinase